MKAGSAVPTVYFPSIEELLAVGSPVTPIASEDRTVHVWGFSLEGNTAAASQCHSWLTKEERARGDRFIRREDRVRYVFAHGGLRAVLAQYTGDGPETLRLDVGSTGKPALIQKGVPRQSIQFNLSHSHGRMLLAIAQKREVGVDLEQIRDKLEVVKLAGRFYAPAEYEHVLNCSGSERRKQFYRYWVAKEAVLKGQGVGLPSLHECEILTTSDSTGSSVRVGAHVALQPGWSVRWLHCGDNWAAAVASCGNDWNIRVMSLSRL